MTHECHKFPKEFNRQKLELQGILNLCMTVQGVKVISQSSHVQSSYSLVIHN